MKLLIVLFFITLLMSGCVQKVRIKALNPAQVGEMATKKKVAISSFRNDTQGLSGKIESKIASLRLDQKRYFTVVSRKDLDKIMAEQKLQSSELMDEETATRVGRLIGAQAIINGEISSANAQSSSYLKSKKECLAYTKGKGCLQWHFYRVTCRVTQASVAASINIVNVETSSIIYADTFDRAYDGDSCGMETLLGVVSLDTGSRKILSKAQALNQLTSQIADDFVYKLTPHYIFFEVALLDSIELSHVTSQQKETFENSLEYIKIGRMKKSEKLLQELLDELDGESYVVSYVLGVVNEAEGKFDRAKKFYIMADDLMMKPVDEINSALIRIDKLIANRNRAKEQINAK